MTLKQRLLSLEAAARGRHDSKYIPAGLGDFALIPDIEAALRVAFPGDDFERRARDFSRRVNGGNASAEDRMLLASLPVGTVPTARLVDSCIVLWDFYGGCASPLAVQP